MIESVVMGIPLPLIYLAENADGKLIVVDGRQRLSTFFRFLDNKFRLRDLKILSQLDGMNLEEMDNNIQYARMVDRDHKKVVYRSDIFTPWGTGEIIGVFLFSCCEGTSGYCGNT